MTTTSRFSSLATTLLCAVALVLFPTVGSAKPSKKEKIVASVKSIENGSTLLVNRSPVGSGASLRCGDLLETDPSETVTVVLPSGEEYILDPSTRVRLTCSGFGPVQFLVVFGGVHRMDGNASTVEPLPFLAAFGFGNFSFPSIGGGGGGSTVGGRIAVKNSQGTVVGFAVTDPNGTVVGFTDVNGTPLTLASGSPNGAPLSSVFGPGATF